MKIHLMKYLINEINNNNQIIDFYNDDNVLK